MITIPAVADAAEVLDSDSDSDSESGPPPSKIADHATPMSSQSKPPPAAPARPKPPRARRAPPGDAVAAGPLPAIHADVQKPLAARTKPKHKSKRPLLLGVGGAVAVLALVAIVGVMLSGSGGSKSGGGGPRAGGERREDSPRAAVPQGSIEFQIGDAQRRDIGIRIDGRPFKIPETGPVRFDVAAGNRRIVLQRRGYQQVDMQLVVPKGDCVVCTPEWTEMWLQGTGTSISSAPIDGSDTPTSPRGFEDWTQDFEVAKQQAAQESKNILILFDGSDWCPPSMRMTHNVFHQPRFYDAIRMRYVLMFVDFPRGAAGQARVQDRERNERLYAQFGSPGFPAVAITDSDGLPFGWAGYAEGVEEFLSQLDRTREDRNKRDSLFMDVSLSQGQDRAAKAMAAFALLGELRVLPFYLGQFGDWFVEARENDPKNEQGQLEAFFEIFWYAQLSDTIRTSPHTVGQVVGQLANWDAEHEFRDPDRAARLYLRAAILSQDTPEVMRKYAAEGIKYRPKNAELAQALKYLHDMAGRLNIVGVGSGFAVGQGGYVLTNHHVVESIEQEGVHLTVHGVAGQEPLPAKVVATNPDRDLALVRIVDSEDIALAPLPVSGKPLARGQSIAAFGYPLGEAVGRGVKLTTGYVSATQEQTDSGMILLDCRINPGNSGGPICGKGGQVVGIVTAKSFSTGEVDSYGMAVPGDQMIAFLQEHMPDFTASTAPEEAPGAADWAAVDQLVSPSVVMLMLRREP
jgi:S1-C subfamily serine protease/thioredoxin-related protein